LSLSLSLAAAAAAAAVVVFVVVIVVVVVVVAAVVVLVLVLVLVVLFVVVFLMSIVAVVIAVFLFGPCYSFSAFVLSFSISFSYVVVCFYNWLRRSNHLPRIKGACLVGACLKGNTHNYKPINCPMKLDGAYHEWEKHGWGQSRFFISTILSDLIVRIRVPC